MIGWASEAYEYANAAIDAFDMVKSAFSPAKLNQKIVQAEDLNEQLNAQMEDFSAMMKNSVTQTNALSISNALVDFGRLPEWHGSLFENHANWAWTTQNQTSTDFWWKH